MGTWALSYFYVNTIITKKLSLHWQLSRKSSCCVPMCIRCHLQAETPCEVSVIFIHHLWTFWMDLRGDVKNLQLVLELDSGHKTRVNKTVNLYNYLRFCSNIMCIAGPNNNLWLTEVIGVDINGHSMPNDSNFALFLQLGVLWVRMGANWRFGDFVVMVILEMKITAFTYLLSSDSEGYDSFPKHLDFALAPNKTNEGVKKQYNTRYHDKSQHIVTYVAVFRLYTFSLVRWRLRTEIEWRWGSWQLLNPLNSFDEP